MKTLILLPLVSLFLSCENGEPTAPEKGTVTFYTGIGGSWNLLIDGSDKGEIDQSLVPPACMQVGFITLDLSIGPHTYDMKSNDGLAWGNNKEFQVAAGCHTFKALY